MGLTASAVAFVVSLLVGGLGIYVGGAVVTDTRDYEHAVWTAAIGALVWGVASFLFGWLPAVGPALTLLAWVWVVNRRYPGGWVNAAAIALLAWAASVGIIHLLARLGVEGLSATGVPGV
ncbi:MAG: hypothetical protein ABEJ68_00360 [Halobacteriaceae archaeon]